MRACKNRVLFGEVVRYTLCPSPLVTIETLTGSPGEFRLALLKCVAM